MLAEVAASGRPANIESRLIGALRLCTTDTVSWPEVTQSGTTGLRRRMTFSGPGQNAATSASMSAVSGAKAQVAQSRGAETKRVSGFAPSRFFMS